MLIQVSWLLQKPTDLDLHCLLRQGMSCSAREGLNQGQRVFPKNPSGKLDWQIENSLSDGMQIYLGSFYYKLYQSMSFFHVART